MDGGPIVTGGRYGGSHQAVRRALLPYAVGAECARCGRPILSGEPVDLDHADDGAGYRGFAHQKCNRQAGGRLGRARQLAQRERIMRMLKTCTLGIEVAEARDHVSVAVAGWVDGGFILVELASYMSGTDPTYEVLRIRRERAVSAVALDPRSPAATALRPLTDASGRSMAGPGGSRRRALRR
jgi:hypothetical protein